MPIFDIDPDSKTTLHRVVSTAQSILFKSKQADVVQDGYFPKIPCMPNKRQTSHVDGGKEPIDTDTDYG